MVCQIAHCRWNSPIPRVPSRVHGNRLMKEFSQYKNFINRTWARFIVINANKKSTSNATSRSLWAIQWLFWGRPPHSYLRVWINAPNPPTPLSKDLDPPLAICCIYRITFHSSPSRLLGYIKWTNSLVRQTETQLFTAPCKGFRIPESWALGSGIQLKETGISPTVGIRNPSRSNDKESGNQYLESKIHTLYNSDNILLW